MDGQKIQKHHFGDLSRWFRNNFCAAAIDHPVIVKLRRYKIADMVRNGKNRFAAEFHGVFGKINNGTVKRQDAVFKNSDRNTGQIPDAGTQILQVCMFHLASLPS